MNSTLGYSQEGQMVYGWFPQHILSAWSTSYKSISVIFISAYVVGYVRVRIKSRIKVGSTDRSYPTVIQLAFVKLEATYLDW